MKAFFAGILVAAIAAVASATALMFGGFVSVAADEPHHPVVFSLLDTARERSIERHSATITVPADLDDTERVRKGAGNYAAMCADCHLSPGVDESEIRLGLYPTPPNLAARAHGHDDDEGVLNPAEAFWVIKHGVKASGMPAWGRGGMTDEDIWNLVALLKAMPRMGLAEYRAWVSSSEGHSHGGKRAGVDHHDDAGHGDAHPGEARGHDAPTSAPHTHANEAPHGH